MFLNIQLGSRCIRSIETASSSALGSTDCHQEPFIAITSISSMIWWERRKYEKDSIYVGLAFTHILQQQMITTEQSSLLWSLVYWVQCSLILAVLKLSKVSHTPGGDNRDWIWTFLHAKHGLYLWPLSKHHIIVKWLSCSCICTSTSAHKACSWGISSTLDHSLKHTVYAPNQQVCKEKCSYSWKLPQ